MALQPYMPALQGSLGIRRPRNKYRNVAESYLSYCKKRKRRASRTKVIILYHLHMPSYFLETFTEYPYIMTVNADDAVTDFPPFKHFLFLYKHLSDDGKTLMIILGISE